jgi:hypothetical protein
MCQPFHTAIYPVFFFSVFPSIGTTNSFMKGKMCESSSSFSSIFAISAFLSVCGTPEYQALTFWMRFQVCVTDFQTFLQFNNKLSRHRAVLYKEMSRSPQPIGHQAFCMATTSIQMQEDLCLFKKKSIKWWNHYAKRIFPFVSNHMRAIFNIILQT